MTPTADHFSRPAGWSVPAPAPRAAGATFRCVGGNVIRFASRVPARTLLALLWLYQRALSPAVPVLFGPACGCRFHPTCSHYAADAVRMHGALAGVWLAARRLARCHPLGTGGLDLVPPSRRPRCVRPGL